MEKEGMAGLITQALEIGTKTEELRNFVLDKTKHALSAEDHSRIEQGFNELKALMQGLVGSFMGAVLPKTETAEETKEKIK